MFLKVEHTCKSFTTDKKNKVDFPKFCIVFLISNINILIGIYSTVFTQLTVNSVYESTEEMSETIEQQNNRAL